MMNHLFKFIEPVLINTIIGIIYLENNIQKQVKKAFFFKNSFEPSLQNTKNTDNVFTPSV